jgi:YHS domain-containing protein
MLYAYRAMVGLTLTVVVALLTGCKPAEQTAEKAKAAKPEAAQGAAAKGPEASGPPAEEGEIAKSLAQLSPEDRAAAERQKVCPVTGQLLGSMDKPVKMTVKGQAVFLCCPACEDDFNKDPDKYLAKLKK